MVRENFFTIMGYNYNYNIYITDTVAYSPTGSTAKNREMSTHPPTSGCGTIYLTLPARTSRGLSAIAEFLVPK